MIEIPVTQDCIYSGKESDAKNCPLAIALQENGYPNAIAGSTKLSLDYINQSRESDYYYTPTLEAWVRDFDNGEEGREFNLQLIEETRAARPRKGDLHDRRRE